MKYKHDISVIGNLFGDFSIPIIDSEYLFIPGGILPLSYSSISKVLDNFGNWIDSLNVKEIIFTLSKTDEKILDIMNTKIWYEFKKERDTVITYIDQSAGIERIINNKLYYILGFNTVTDDDSIHSSTMHYRSINTKYGKNIITISAIPPVYIIPDKQNGYSYKPEELKLTNGKYYAYNRGFASFLLKINSSLIFYGYDSVMDVRNLSKSIRYNSAIHKSTIQLNTEKYDRCRFKAINAVHFDKIGTKAGITGVRYLNIR